MYLLAAMMKTVTSWNNSEKTGKQHTCNRESLTEKARMITRPDKDLQNKGEKPGEPS